MKTLLAALPLATCLVGSLCAQTLSSLAQGLLAGSPPGQVITWGRYIGGLGADVPVPFGSAWTGTVTTARQPLRDIVAIAAGNMHALALRADGTVLGWGFDYYGQSTGAAVGNNRPTDGLVRIGGRVLSNVVAIAAGNNFSLGLKNDGTVAAWGDNRQGETAVPDGLKGVVAIAAGCYHGLALQSDGRVVQWGGHGLSPPPGLSDVIAIAAGGKHFERDLALRRDGTVVAWGIESDYHDATPPPGLSNVVAIAVGEHHSLALRSDGTVVGWGLNSGGEATGVATVAQPCVASGPVALSGHVLTNVVAIAAGNEYGVAGIDCRNSLALTRGGIVIAWGRLGFAPASVPGGLTNVTAIAAGQNFCLALAKD